MFWKPFEYVSTKTCSYKYTYSFKLKTSFNKVSKRFSKFVIIEFIYFDK